MDEPGNHHSQQTDMRIENQRPHVLTHKWVLNNKNTWTQEGNITHWGLLGGIGEGQQWGSWGGIAWGEMPDVGEGEEGTLPRVYLCNYHACSLHVLQNLKCNLKKTL